MDKTDKFAHVMEVVLSLDKLNNTDNLEDEKLSNVLLRCQVTCSEEFMSFEPVALQYKRLKNGEFTSLILRMIDPKDISITDGLELIIVLHIR